MKQRLKLIIGFCALATTTLLVLSCVNGIHEDPEMEPGEIPIRVSTEILCSKITRVTDESFDDGDAIGLYILVQPAKINGKRYISNARFTCSSVYGLEADEPIFYPKEEVKCEFISYYPYQGSGIETDNSTMDVTIKADQSTGSNLSSSDFVVANNKDIIPGNNMVPLSFNHKFCKMRIVLKSPDEEELNDLSASNPVIIMSGFHTKASYDFSTDQFNSFGAPGSITPYGTWEVKNEKLIGKEVNLIPETLTDNHKVTLKVNDKSYTCSFPSTFSLNSGTINEMVLNYDSSEGIRISNLGPSIVGWTEGSKGEANPEKNEAQIKVDDLTFTESNVYKAMCDGVQVAEITKEYLLSPNVSSQAIVAYPFKDGKADLKNGTVIQWVGNSGNTIGGQVAWDDKNALTYTPGTSGPVNGFYITPEHSISLSMPTSPLTIWLEKDVLTDIRAEEMITYPIAKIGTQYWMADNLKATKYTNGNSIKNKKNESTMDAGYYSAFFASSTVIFYNAAAVNTGKVAPLDWKIPNADEWGALRNYLKNNALLLKTGKWYKDKDGKTSEVLTEPTGFNGLAKGFFYEKESKEIYANSYYMANYWISGNSENTVAEKSMLLFYEHNRIAAEGNPDKKGLSIRCVRK